MMGIAFSTQHFSELTRRLFTALVLAPCILYAIWLGSWFFWCLVMILACVAFIEWYLMTSASPYDSRVIFSLLFGIFSLFGAGISILWGNPFLSMFSILSGALVSWLLQRTVFAPLGVFYIGGMLLSLLMLRTDVVYGQTAMLFMIMVVWVTDIGAFFSGRLIGGWKICPQISPGKTWSGFIGGMISSSIVGIVFAYGTKLAPISILLLVASFFGLMVQLGDLFESAVKRFFSVKDSGFLLPGHGGILDRIDGLIFAAIAAAFLGSMRSSPYTVGSGILVW